MKARAIFNLRKLFGAERIFESYYSYVNFLILRLTLCSIRPYRKRGLAVKLLITSPLMRVPLAQSVLATFASFSMRVRVFLRGELYMGISIFILREGNSGIKCRGMLHSMLLIPSVIEQSSIPTRN